MAFKLIYWTPMTGRVLVVPLFKNCGKVWTFLMAVSFLSSYSRIGEILQSPLHGQLWPNWVYRINYYLLESLSFTDAVIRGLYRVDSSAGGLRV